MTDAKGVHHTMDELWDVARSRFEQRTGKSLEFRPAKTLEDCVIVLEQQQALNEHLPLHQKPARAAKAKEYGLNILQCLKLVGGVAADGASMAGVNHFNFCRKSVRILTLD